MTLTALRDLMARVDLPSGLFWSAQSAQIDPAALFPGEVATIARAVPHRQAEFTGGRKAARAAMEQMGIAPCAIPPAITRAPIFPESVVGSISHDSDLCLALVGAAPQWRALGVDITRNSPLEPSLVSEICRPEELQGIPPEQQGQLARQLFCAKEAVYKAQFALTGAMFGFHGLRVNLDQQTAQFVNTPETDSILNDFKAAPIPVQQIAGGGLILSISAIPT